jgi:hypothetical protein
MSYYYRSFEPGLWTVGTDDGGRFTPESDHDSPQEAAARVAELNGNGNPAALLRLAADLGALAQSWADRGTAAHADANRLGPGRAGQVRAAEAGILRDCAEGLRAALKGS